MIDFEKKIMMEKKNIIEVNHDQFLEKLHSRIKLIKYKRHTFFTSSAMVITILFFILTQFGAPNSRFDNNFLDNTNNLLETDFWNIESDSFKYDQEFFNNMAYFLFDEGYVWEAVELLDQFELTKEES